MNTTSTRRAILAGAAAMPALSLPAIAGEPDPIFAAIERHRISEAAYDQAFADDDGDFEQASQLQSQSNGIYDELLATTPTTLAGCAALLRRVEEYAAKYDATLYAGWCESISEPGASLLSRIAAVLGTKA